jgi:hypothetical protein
MAIGPVLLEVATRDFEIGLGGDARLVAPFLEPRSGSARRLALRALLGGFICLTLAVDHGPAAQAQATSSSNTAGILDGQSFSGTVGALGKQTPYNDDSIEFADGQFLSTDCVHYGFTRAPYTAERVGDAIRFRAVIRSPTHGTMSWEGTIRGDRAEAEYRWIRERWFWTQRGEYWFKGQRGATGR